MSDSDYVDDASSISSENASSEHRDGGDATLVDAPVDGVPVAVAVAADFGADIDAVVDAAGATAGTGAAVAGGRGCGRVGCGRGAVVMEV